MKYFKNNKLYYLITAAILSCSIFLFFTNFFILKNKSTYDLFNKIRGSREYSKKILIVEVDEASMQILKKKWPWSRSVFADAIKKISQGKPASIALDFTFSTTGDPYEDSKFEQVLEQIKPINVVSGANLSIETKVSKHSDEEIYFIQKNSLKPIFADMEYGFINISIDKDGVIRETNLLRDQNEELFDSFALRIIKQVNKKIYGNWKKEIADNIDKTFIINYAGPANTYKKISFYQVINNLVPKKYFKNKIILIGPTFIASHDYHRTPFSEDNRVNGVEIHASIIDYLINRNFYSKTTYLLDIIILCLIFLAALFFFLTRLSLYKKLIFSFILLLFFTFISFVLFKNLLIINYFTIFSSFLLLILSLSITFVFLKLKEFQREISFLKSSEISAAELFSQKYNITRREKEIILLMMKEYTNKKICEKLFISINTIKKHINNIYKKLEINNREELFTMLKNEKLNISFYLKN